MRCCVEGFFPAVPSDDDAGPTAASSVSRSSGLPYAADPAVTRHLARFLRGRRPVRAAASAAVRRGPSGLACPTHVLFNGGVMKADAAARADRRRAERLAAATRDSTRSSRARARRAGSRSRRRARRRVLRPARGADAACASAAARRAATTSASRARCRPFPGMPGAAQGALRRAVRDGGGHQRRRCLNASSGWSSASRRSSGFSARRSARRDPPGAMIEDWGDDLEELSPLEVTLPDDGPK